MQYFLGGGIQLSNASFAGQAKKIAKLKTTSMGVVQLNLSIITRNFDRFGIHCWISQKKK